MDELTEDQKAALKEEIQDIKSGKNVDPQVQRQ